MKLSDIEGLTIAVKGILDDVAKEAHRAADETVNEISKEVLKVVKENAPVHATPSKRRGTYKKNIARKKTKSSEHEVEYTIYVKPPETGLSHLLEHGHQTVNGGRTRKFPHFAQGQELADQKIEKEFEKKFKP